MGSEYESRRQSWRQSSGSKHSSGAGSVLRRRVLSSVTFLVLLIVAGLMAVSLFRSRYQHTLVASLFTTSRTQTGEPEQPFTLAPLRFAPESLAPMLEHSTTELQVRSLSESFDNTQNLVAGIEQIISELRDDDALILWVRAKGVSFENGAYLISGDFRLPQSELDVASTSHAVPFRSIVEAVSLWQGPSLILLDWGNQLVDARLGMGENRFLPFALESMKTAPPRVHCLVSHQRDQLSLDGLTSKQTLFGRACAEAMTGARRQPADYQPLVSSAMHILVGDLAEYVIRRVSADSIGRQLPWLMQGGTGWVAVEQNRWKDTTNVPIIQLGKNGRPIRWSDLSEDAPAEVSEELTVQELLSTTPPVDGADIAKRLVLSEAIWPTAAIWDSLDKWRVLVAPTTWSAATVAPLTVRRLSTTAVEYEARWLAGNAFRASQPGAVEQAPRVDGALLANIERLRREVEQERLLAEQTGRADALARLEPARPLDVSESDFTNWQQQVRALAAYRALALSLPDAIGLSDNLSQFPSLRGTSDLAGSVRQSIQLAHRFSAAWSPAQSGSASSRRLVNWATLAQQMHSAQEGIAAQISTLVNRASDRSLMELPLLELLLRYPWLSLGQRNELLQAAYAVDSSASAGAWPTKDLSLLQPPTPEATSRADTLWLEALGLAKQPTDSRQATAGSHQLEILSLLADNARRVLQAQPFSESTWWQVDGRDLCQQTIDINFQQPVLPASPEPPAQWRVAWRDADSSNIEGRLPLTSTSQPTKVNLTFTKIGAAESIQAVELEFRGTRLRAAGATSAWQTERARFGQEHLLVLPGKDYETYLLELEVLPAAVGSATATLDARIRAGGNSTVLPTLVCEPPVDTPVQIAIQQLVRREGQLQWETCEQRGELLFLRPFPGRKNQFRVVATNQDTQVLTATVELYRLPAQDRTLAKGRVAAADGAIPRQIEALRESELDRLAVSPPFSLPGKQASVVVNFASPVTGNESEIASSSGGPQASPGKPTGSSAKTELAHDVSWGLLAVVRLASEPTKQWRNWLQLLPTDARSFMLTDGKVTDDARRLEVTVGIEPKGRLPADLTAEQPIEVACEIGAGIDLSRSILPSLRGALTLEKTSETFVISSHDPIESEVETRFHVDGSPRALFHFVGVGGRTARREPPDRLWVQSIKVDGSYEYLAGFQTQWLDAQRSLAQYQTAIFGRPVPSDIQILLSVDSQARSRPDALPAPVKFKVMGGNWEYPTGGWQVYGDRDLQASLTGTIAEEFTIDCKLSDWKFAFAAPIAQGDLEISLEGSVGHGGEGRLNPKIIVDGTGPRLLSKELNSTSPQGQSARFSFSVAEHGPIGQAKLLIYPAGLPAQTQQLGEILTAREFTPVSGGWKLSNYQLPIGALIAGNYELRVEMEDSVGNQAILGPWPLKIDQPPAASSGLGGGAMPLKGTLQGRLFFGSGTSKPPNPVAVTIKELPAKTASSNDGKFSLTEVETGTYTVIARMVYQGAEWKGEKVVVLEKIDDWRRLVEISLQK